MSHIRFNQVEFLPTSRESQWKCETKFRMEVLSAESSLAHVDLLLLSKCHYTHGRNDSQSLLERGRRGNKKV